MNTDAPPGSERSGASARVENGHDACIATGHQRARAARSRRSARPATTAASAAGSTRRCWKRCRSVWRGCRKLRVSVGRRSSMSFGTLKAWMGSTHFLMKTLPKVQNRDEFACLGLQLEAGDADLRGRAADEGHEGMKSPLDLTANRSLHRTLKRQTVQPLLRNIGSHTAWVKSRRSKLSELSGS